MLAPDILIRNFMIAIFLLHLASSALAMDKKIIFDREDIYRRIEKLQESQARIASMLTSVPVNDDELDDNDIAAIETLRKIKSMYNPDYNNQKNAY